MDELDHDPGDMSSEYPEPPSEELVLAAQIGIIGLRNIRAGPRCPGYGRPLQLGACRQPGRSLT